MNYLLSEIARIVGGEHRGCDLRVKEVATDSRGVMSSDDMVFVAINGKNHDGHNFIPQMVVRGVRAFITERAIDVAEGSGVVIVDSAIVALQRLAAHHRRNFKGRVVAIIASKRSISPGSETPASMNATSSSPSSISNESATPSCEL